MGANYITLAAMANWLIPQITLKEGKGGGKGGDRECWIRCSPQANKLIGGNKKDEENEMEHGMDKMLAQGLIRKANRSTSLWSPSQKAVYERGGGEKGEEGERI